MTPEEFNDFLTNYRSNRVVRILDRDFANMFGVSADTFTRLKQRGAPVHGKVFKLALAALHHNLKPHGE